MSNKKFRTLFISDVHLGTSSCKAEYLLDFLATVSAETIYLVGDIVDVQSLRKRFYWPESHQKVVERLFEIAKEGIRVVYIPGNHDHIFRMFAGHKLRQIEVLRNDFHETVDGRVFLVSHGDEFDAHLQIHPLLNFLGDRGFQFISFLNTRLYRARKLFGLPYWSLASKIKRNVPRAMTYVDRFEKAALQSTKRLKVEGYIGGHIHHANIRELNGKLYCNDGDWVEHCTALVEDSTGTLSIMHWSERKEVVLQESREKNVFSPV